MRYLKKILIASVLILGAGLLIALNSFRQVGIMYDKGYVITENNIQGALATGTGTEPVIAAEVRLYDPVYSRGEGLYIGETKKVRIDTNYPQYVSEGAGIKLLSGREVLITEDFSSMETYPYMIINEGVAGNEDGSRASWDPVLFVRLNNGLHINSGYMYVDTETKDHTVSSNAIIGFSEEKIACYEYSNGFFRYREIGDVDDQSVIRIGDVTVSYKELRKKLGIYQEKTPSSGFKEFIKNLFTPEQETPKAVEESSSEAETETAAGKKKQTKKDGSVSDEQEAGEAEETDGDSVILAAGEKEAAQEAERDPAAPAAPEPAEAAAPAETAAGGGAGGGGSGQPSTEPEPPAPQKPEPPLPPQEPSGSETPAEPEPGGKPKPRDPDAGKGDPVYPDWKMPRAKAGETFTPGVYTLKMTVTVDDPAGVLYGGITYDIYTIDQSGKTSFFRSSAQSSYIPGVESPVLIADLKPDTRYLVTGWFQYKDKFDNKVAEKVVFLEKHEFTTRTVGELAPVYLEDLGTDLADIHGDSVSVPNVRFTDDSDPDAIGSMKRVYIRYTDKETGAVFTADVDDRALDILKSWGTVTAGSGRILDAGRQYYLDMVACDRYENVILPELEEGAAKPEYRDKSGFMHHGLSRTCKLLPQAVLGVTVDRNDLSSHITVSLKNPSGIEYTDEKIRILDGGGKTVKINGSEYTPLKEGEEVILDSLTPNRNYTCEYYVTCDIDDGKGLITRAIASKRFVSSPIDLLGTLYFDCNNITSSIAEDSAAGRAILTLAINRENTSEELIALFDALTVTFKSSFGEVDYVLSAQQIRDLRDGKTIQIDTDEIKKTLPTFNGLRSNTRYTLSFDAAHVVETTDEKGETDREYIPITKIWSSIKSITTGLTKIIPEIKNVTAFEGYLGMDIRLEDVDGMINGDDVLVYCYTKEDAGEKLVGAFSFVKNDTEFFRLRMLSSPPEGQPSYEIKADTDYEFRFVAAEMKTGEKSSDFNVNFFTHTVSTKTGITGRIYLGGLTEKDDTAFTAKIYMDMEDPKDTLTGEDKVIYVDKYRITDGTGEDPEPVETLSFPYQDGGHTFLTTPGWTSAADGQFYDDAYVEEHREEFVSVLPEEAQKQGYRQLEYVESAGSSYINTGVSPENGSYSLNIVFQTTAVAKQSIAGSVGSRASIEVRTLDSGAPDTSAASFTSTKINVKNEAYATVNADGGMAPIYLFAANRDGIPGGNAKVKIYAATITDLTGGTVKRDMIPCLSPEGDAGLYDLAENRFYKATGTALIAGPEIVILKKTWKPTHNLPEGYEEVEWIENTAGTYIKTDLIPTGKTKTYIRYYSPATITSDIALYGSRTAYTAKDSHSFWVSPSICYPQIGSNSASVSGGSLGYHEYSMSIEEGAFLDGRKLRSYQPSDFTASSLPMFIFGLNQNGALESRNATHRVYEFVVYEDNTCVGDFVPARNRETSVYGLYDTVRGKFFTASGKGTIVGPSRPFVPTHDIPDDYQEVEYIESHGTEYIDTGYTFTNVSSYTFNIRVNPSAISGDNFILGARTGNAGGRALRFNLCGSKLQNSGYVYDDNVVTSPAMTVNTVYDVTASGESGKNDVYVVNGKSYTLKGTPQNSLSTGYPVSLLGINTNGTVQSQRFKGKIYKFDLTVDNKRIRDFVPVMRESDNVYGMYDMVTGEFFGNAGTGAFTGPYIMPEVDLPARYRQVGYIEGHGKEYIDTLYAGQDLYQIDCHMEITGSVLNNYWFGQDQAHGAMMFNGLYSNRTLEYNWLAISRTANNDITMYQKDIGNGQINITMNGVSTVKPIGVNDSVGHFLIFACNSGRRNYGSNLRLYWFKMHIGDEVIRDFIPAYDTMNQEYGLYDLKAHKFYGNASGKGAFTGPAFSEP